MTTAETTSETVYQRYHRRHREERSRQSREWYAANIEAERRRAQRVKAARRDRCWPSKEAKGAMAAEGLRWCHGCALWLPAKQVLRSLCRGHENERCRQYYAAGGKTAIAARVHARKRGVDPIPAIGRNHLMEMFDGRCAYCPAPATTFDHLIPVARGGRTKRGNVVPACVSCNSRKRTKNLVAFLSELPPDQIHPALNEELSLGVFDEWPEDEELLVREYPR